MATNLNSLAQWRFESRSLKPQPNHEQLMIPARGKISTYHTVLDPTSVAFMKPPINLAFSPLYHSGVVAGKDFRSPLI